MKNYEQLKYLNDDGILEYSEQKNEIRMTLRNL